MIGSRRSGTKQKDAPSRTGHYLWSGTLPIGELVDWFADDRCGIAVVCGALSGGLVVLDIESIPAYDQWRMYAATLLPAACP